MSHSQKIGQKWESVDFANTIHINEKWFYVMKAAQKISFLLKNGHLGAPKAQSKAFIKKEMLLAAIGGPTSGQMGHTFVDSLVFSNLLRRALRLNLARIKMLGRQN